MANVIEEIKLLLRPTVYHLRYLRRRFMSNIYPQKITNAKDIPIIINNRNRLTCVLQLIAALEKRGYFNIYIIDNDSSYPPLLEWYDKTHIKVFRLKENVGFLALWKTPLYKQFIKDYYVYTDSDVVPIEECPDDFLDLFWQTLKEKKRVQKIGFSLKIDDLPDEYANKQAVINWEKQFYEKPASPQFYEALIDTTFALYRPWMTAGKGGLMYRSAYPYEARHMPWYVNSAELNEEEIYYIKHAKTSTHWTNLHK